MFSVSVFIFGNTVKRVKWITIFELLDLLDEISILTEIFFNWYVWSVKPTLIKTINESLNLINLGDIDRKTICEKLKIKGSTFLLKTELDEVLGCAVKTTESGVNPVFVSIGTGDYLLDMINIDR